MNGDLSMTVTVNVPGGSGAPILVTDPRTGGPAFGRAGNAPGSRGQMAHDGHGTDTQETIGQSDHGQTGTVS